MEEVEDEFNMAIHVYSLQENKTAQVIRLSKNHDVTDKMHLNLYENHFSFLSKFKSYARKYQCPSCSRFVSKSEHLTRHIRKCEIGTKHIYVGGKYMNRKTIFECLEEVGIDVPEADRYDEYFTVFDFEAYQAPEEDEEQGRTFHFEHIPATVSICSSVPGHTEPHHIQSDGEPQDLVDRFVMKLHEVQESREQLLTAKYQPYLDKLLHKMADIMWMLGIDDSKDNGNTNKEEKEEEEVEQKE